MKILTAPPAPRPQPRQLAPGEESLFDFASKDGMRVRQKMIELEGRGNHERMYSKIYREAGVSESHAATIKQSISRWTGGYKDSPEQQDVYAIADRLINGNNKKARTDKGDAYKKAAETRSDRWRRTLDALGLTDIPTPTHLALNRGVKGEMWVLDVAKAWADEKSTHVAIRSYGAASWGFDLKNGKNYGNYGSPGEDGVVFKWDAPIENTLVDQVTDDSSFIGTFIHEHECIAGEGHDKGVKLPKDADHLVTYRGETYTYATRKKLIERLKKDGKL
jgi:hypothetical protein